MGVPRPYVACRVHAMHACNRQAWRYIITVHSVSQSTQRLRHTSNDGTKGLVPTGQWRTTAAGRMPMGAVSCVQSRHCPEIPAVKARFRSVWSGKCGNYDRSSSWE